MADYFQSREKKMKRFLLIVLSIVMLLSVAGCSTGAASQKAADAVPQETAVEAVPQKKTVTVIYTNDVHCAVDTKLGYTAVAEIKQVFQKAGNDVLLVDSGDAIQGGNIGVLSQGGYIIDIMNKLGYDTAIPGNHEFDYSINRFMELREKAEFPYISCNITDIEGKTVLDPYIIKEAGGNKIAFVGICTPSTLISTSPKSFRNEKGEFIYDFCQEGNGEKLYAAVQKAVDDAKGADADYVIALAHLGIEEVDAGYTSYDVIAHTHGIDAVLDGHSHVVIECETVKNSEGKDVILTSTGINLQNVGCLTITPEGKLSTTLINDNGTGELLKAQKKDLDQVTQTVVGHSDFDLIASEPLSGIEVVRLGETNLGDFCTDAYRAMLHTDIAIVNGGGVRVNIPAGDITFSELINVHPFNNTIVVCKATGQQIIDALELGAEALPSANGNFMQVSGMSYTIDTNIEPSVEKSSDGRFIGVNGVRRVKNVKVGGEPIELERTYTLAGNSFTLKQGGGGMCMFENDEFVSGADYIEIQILYDYLNDVLSGKVSEEYADPSGQGRITVINNK